MPKRKSQPEESNRESDSDSQSIVNVDFDFCDFRAQTDYLSMKRLLQQLFHTDATLFDLGSIADAILAQDDVGSTVKTDGVESDPFAFIALLAISHPVLKTLKEYLLSKTTRDPKFHKTLQDNLSTTGVIISERVYNMPPQIVPPLYRILNDEIGWAVEDGKPYSFSHYLILSRVYNVPPGEEDETEPSEPSTKKRKTSDKVKQKDEPRVKTLHAEDECIQKVAFHCLDFPYSHQEPRSNGDIGSSTAGVEIGGRIMLLPAEKLELLVTDLERTFPPPAPTP